MCIIDKKKRPVTAGSRNQRILNKCELSKKSLVLKTGVLLWKRQHGRSRSTGSITTRHKGGGHKKRYLHLNYSSRPAVLICILNSYNPNSSNFRSLKFDLNAKTFDYSLSTNTVLPGVVSTCNSPSFELSTGSRLMLKYIPPGSFVHEISSSKEEHKYARSAGSYCTLIQTIKDVSFIKLPSKKLIEVPSTFLATLGVSNNGFSSNVRLGKAGQNRNRGKRPSVRGIAMNPVDHPHGGRTNGGKPSVTPWGLPTKSGFKLRKKKHYE